MHPIHEADLEFLYYNLKELGSNWESYFQSIDPKKDMNHDLLERIKKVWSEFGLKIKSFDEFMTRIYSVCYEKHLVGFMDILGFKNMLLSGKTGLCMRAFEKAADTIYSRRRWAYLMGTFPIEPKIYNFSDSIIVYSKLFDGNQKNDNQYVFDEFISVIRDIVASLLKIKVPVRGAVTVGDLYCGDVSSYQPKRVYRYGPQHGFFPDIAEKHSSSIESYKTYETKILPKVRFPVHFGNALTDAYLLESRIECIGAFSDGSLIYDSIVGEYIERAILFGKISRVSLGNKNLLAYNWCNRIHHDDYLELREFITKQADQRRGRIGKKWKSLLEVMKHLKT